MILRLNVAGLTTPLVRGVVTGVAEHNVEIFRSARKAGPVAPPHLRGLYRNVAPATELAISDAIELDTAKPIDSCGSWSACLFGWLRAIGKRASLNIERTRAGVWHVTVDTAGGVWDPAKELPHG